MSIHNSDEFRKGDTHTMTTRELWRAIMHYEAFDRMPVLHWTCWQETLTRWRAEGLPPDAQQHDYFDAKPMWRNIGVNLWLDPPFPEETLEETESYRIFRGQDGVVCKAWKHRNSIPHYMDFTLKTAADWPQFKARLQPSPKRIPADLDKRIGEVERSGLPVVADVTSLMGWIRNWMGVENMCYLMYDDRDCYADMVNTLADLTCWGLDQLLPRMKVMPDMGFGWEDICGKNGPLVSPDIFDQCVAPCYAKIRNKLGEYGIHLFAVDSDGLVEPLVRHWLDAGVNVQFPVERGTWNALPEQLRKRFGKDLRIIGGFDKLALEKGRSAIDGELADRMPLMREGGFILMPDHLITPGVPLADYRYYLERVRALRFH